MPGAPSRASERVAEAARVLIVDDSAVARAVIGRAVEAGDFVVAGAVPTAPAALAFLRRERVDFILLDIEMPGVDGLTALPDIIATARGARVIVVSSADDARVRATLQALALGAVDKVAKPMAGSLDGAFAERLLAKLSALSAETPPLPAAPSRSAGSVPGFDPTAFDIVAVGASTGGIHALSALFGTLSPDMPLPILVTQHLPASFMPYFAAQLAGLSGRPCDVATDYMRVRPNHVVLAPGDAHIRCVPLPDGGASIRLQRGVSASGCLPSVDPMLASAVDVFGPRVLAVMLSGMGRDGAEGARLVHAAGGTILAQDRTTSVVWGMPGAVADIAAAQLDPASIGTLIGKCRKS